MDWSAVGSWIWTHIVAFLSGLGFTGSGYGFLIAIRNLPAPHAHDRHRGFWFDFWQTVAVNTDRVGERVMDDGALGFIERPKREKT